MSSQGDYAGRFDIWPWRASIHQVRAVVQLLPVDNLQMVIAARSYPPRVEVDFHQLVTTHSVNYLSEVSHEAQWSFLPLEEPQLHFI